MSNEMIWCFVWDLSGELIAASLVTVFTHWGIYCQCGNHHCRKSFSNFSTSSVEVIQSFLRNYEKLAEQNCNVSFDRMWRGVSFHMYVKIIIITKTTTTTRTATTTKTTIITISIKIPLFPCIHCFTCEDHHSVVCDFVVFHFTKRRIYRLNWRCNQNICVKENLYITAYFYLKHAMLVHWNSNNNKNNNNNNNIW